NAYDVVYYAGDCNAGSKTIAVNLPNDEVIQQEKGTRRSQLKNAMQAKYDKILIPIAETLIVPEQRKHVTFEAFFANTMFHEVAHGLGIKNTINGKGTVREALKDKASALEEGKADILGLYMVKSLFEKGEITEGELMDYYVTFVTSIFRSVRFGASSAHGKANMLRFNFFAEKGAILRDRATGLYRVDGEKLVTAMNQLSELILQFQGNGDYEGVAKIMEEKGNIGKELQKDLDRLNKAGIPVDIVFEQGSAGDALYIIADGQVGVKVNDTDGDSYVALYLGKGQVFGEMALIDQGTRSATIIAAEDHTEIYRISTQDFITLCTQRPDIGYILMRNIAQDLSFKLRHRSAD
ncbi:MAG: hypothetical protein CUN56_01815, partial [Phototrophicales bacterium]